MRTDGIVFGRLTDMGDHFHLNWICPDCRGSGSVPGGSSPWRFVCSLTEREFVVLEFQVKRKPSLRRKQLKYAA
jgi:hypothetical protein